MKKVFTKSFWQGVKKTFDQARRSAASAKSLGKSGRGRPERVFHTSDPIAFRDIIVPTGPERNQRNYSLISIASIGTNDGTERNSRPVQPEIGSARFRCGSARSSTVAPRPTLCPRA